MDLIKNGVNKNITFYRKINFELLYIYYQELILKINIFLNLYFSLLLENTFS